MATTYELSNAEHATVLAALRFYQQQIGVNQIPGAILDIADNGETVTPLDDDDIDALCERINY